MANTPRDPGKPDKNRPESDRTDQPTVNDPNRERDNDGLRRQQQGEQNRPGQQGGQQGDKGDVKRPDQDKQERKPQQR
jgi:hypothetical protein